MKRALLILSLLLLGMNSGVSAEPITVKTSTYQLDSGQFVRRWLDEPMQLLCLAVVAEKTGTVQALTCVPMQVTAYGLPASEH